MILPVSGEITDELSCFIAQYVLEYFRFELLDNANYKFQKLKYTQITKRGLYGF